MVGRICGTGHAVGSTAKSAIIQGVAEPRTSMHWHSQLPDADELKFNNIVICKVHKVSSNTIVSGNDTQHK